MYKISFYVPEHAVELVKKSLFNAGAGHIGNYKFCSWQTLGKGQFQPMENSRPTLGQHGRTEVVSEYKVELVCDDEHIERAIFALKNTHPYEEPAYEVIKLENF